MKICIITGGSNGIGKNMVEKFLEKDYKVINLDIIEDKREGVRYIKTDLSQAKEIKKAFKIIEEEYKKAHILINNGAVTKYEKSILETEEGEYDKILDTNLKGTYLCCKEFIRLNKGETYGRIINLASTRWHQNEANWELYGMSKGGIVSLTNTLCVSLIGTPITVNAISPGYIHTGNRGELEESEHKIHPSNRVGMPRDISNVCLFLADEENDFINGANIIVDGGMTKKMIY